VGTLGGVLIPTTLKYPNILIPTIPVINQDPPTETERRLAYETKTKVPLVLMGSSRGTSQETPLEALSLFYPTPVAQIQSRGAANMKTMAGGPKHKWLTENRPLILWYLDLFGPEKTKKQFNLTHDTLHRLETRPEKPHGFHLAKPDKALALAEIAKVGVQENSQRIKELEAAFSQFTESVGKSLGQQFSQAITQFLQRAITLDPSLEPREQPAPLSLDTLSAQASKPPH